jgi:hypothetical protein
MIMNEVLPISVTSQLLSGCRMKSAVKLYEAFSEHFHKDFLEQDPAPFLN